MRTNERKFDCLEVTSVSVYPFKEGASMGRLKGLATVVLNDQLLVRGLRIMDSENGLYVGYPNDHFCKADEMCSVFSPITRALRERIETCVLEKYQQAIG